MSNESITDSISLIEGIDNGIQLAENRRKKFLKTGVALGAAGIVGVGSTLGIDATGLAEIPPVFIGGGLTAATLGLISIITSVGFGEIAWHLRVKKDIVISIVQIWEATFATASGHYGHLKDIAEQRDVVVNDPKIS
jgi:hypothetical protein